MGSALTRYVDQVRRRRWVFAIVIMTAWLAAAQFGSQLGKILVFGAVLLALGLWAVSSPVVAAHLLLVALFLMQPLRSLVHIQTDAFKFVLVLLVVAMALWMNRAPGRLRGIGAVEWAMALYLAWNVYSMLAPHQYPAGPQVPSGRTNELAFSVPSFIGLAVVVPCVFYVVGRYAFDRTSAVRAALLTILAIAAYSATMSILPFTGPTKWVWPQYILHDPEWGGRAVGVLAQPFENGMVLTLGFAIAVMLLSRRREPTALRLAAAIVAVGCGVGIYLTHTRAVWLGAAAMLIIGAVLARGFRGVFIASLCLVTTMVVVKWSVFSSADREAGGVASVSQIQDRLNDDQTALWAAARKPLTGWGIGRFYSVNTYHHQQWSVDSPWIRGYGNAAHQNELGILAELGLVGLALWLCVVGLIAYRLWRAYRRLPDSDLCGKPLAVIAIMGFAILLCTGLTVDLRFFGFPIAAIFLLVGIVLGWSERHVRGQVPTGGDTTEHAQPRHRERRAVWASTEEPGGIASYVRVMQQTPLWKDWNIRHIVTHRDGSAAGKILVFARGALLFIVELIRFRPQVVHLHAAGDTSFMRKAILLWISQLACVPVVIHIHAGSFPDYYESSSGAIRAVIRATLGRASAVVVLGEIWETRLRAIAPTARMTVIPNAVRPADRSIQPVRGEPVGVVFLGRIGDHKGSFRLLDAWAQLDGEAATLTIAGDGEVERARRRIQELHLADTVEVHEWQSESAVYDLLSRAQVLALPSRSEGQSMAVLEAMARGLCVVAADVGGLPEMIGGGCGVLVSPDDTEAIAAGLRLVIHDHELRSRCGAAAYARVADQFDARTVWRRLDALYREVAR